MTSSNPVQKSTNKNLYFWIIFLFLLSIYLLSFNGFPVSDDEHVFASITQSLITRGSLNPTQVFGNSRISGFYEGVGPLHSIIAAVFMSLIWKTNLGFLQGLYLLNPIYTAATAGFIYLLAKKYSFKHKTAIFSALFFGLTSIAWPYTQTFYREPLAMLLIIAAIWVFENNLELETENKYKIFSLWLLFTLLLLAALLTKILLIVCIPFFIYRLFKFKSYKLNKQNLKTTIIIILASSLFIFLFSWMTINFFSNRLSILFFRKEFSHFIRNLMAGSTWIKAILGILISPMKGLLIYSPILILSMFSFLKRFEKKNRNNLFFIGIPSVVIFVQAVMYGDKWWNISWGTRFVLPLIPLMIIAALPVIEELLNSKKLIIRMLIILIPSTGFVIQLGRILITDVIYLDYLYTLENIPDLALALWRTDLMPFFKHWQLFLNGAIPNLASFRIINEQPKFVLLLQLVLLFLISIYFQLLFSKKPYNLKKYLLFFSSITILSMVFLLIVYRFDPLYKINENKYVHLSNYIEENAEKEDLILVDSYMSEFWFYFINFGRAENQWFSLYPSNNDIDKINNQIADIEAIISIPANIWIVTEINLTPGDGIIHSNSKNLFKINCWGEDISKSVICLYK